MVHELIMVNSNTRRQKGRQWIIRLVGLVLSTGLALYLLKQIDAQEFLNVVRRISLAAVAIALMIYVTMNCFRAIRFRTLLDQPQLSLQKLLPITLYHNFWVRILPFKTGEISYVILMQRYLRQSAHSGISSLVVARLFELFMVMVGGETGLLLTSEQFTGQRFLSLILLPCIIIYLVALYHSGTLLHSILQLTHKMPGRVAHFGSWLRINFGALADDLERVRQRRIFAPALVTSVFTYGLSISFNLVLLVALGVPVSPALLLTASIVILLEALPLTTFSGLGVIEGGWTFGLVTFIGLNTGQAASIGFFLHGCQIAAAALAGIGSYLWLQLPEHFPVTI
jgi:uncharacterized protein (TIRG00374 family)